MKIINKIKALLNFITSFWKARKRAAKYNSKLNYGHYFFIMMADRNLLLVHKDVIEHEFLQKMRINYSAKVVKLSFLLSKVYRPKVGVKNGNYTVLLLGKNGDDKLFDLAENKVLSVISSPSRLEQIERSYDLFNKYYNIPITGIDIKNNTIEEKLIDYKNPEELSLKELRQQLEVVLDASISIYKDTLASNQNTKSITTSELVEKFLKDTNNNPLAQGIVKNIPQANMADEWPLVMGHGDTHEWNMLMGSDALYVIDWECFGDYIFGFDVIYAWLQIQRKRPWVSLIESKNTLECKIKEFYQLNNHNFCTENINYYYSIICVAIYYKELRVSQEHDTWLVWCNGWLETIGTL